MIDLKLNVKAISFNINALMQINLNFQSGMFLIKRINRKHTAYASLHAYYSYARNQ